MRYTILYHPKSGQGRAEAMAHHLARSLPVASLHPTTSSTLFNQDAETRLILCGGDGSFHHLSQQIKRPLAVYLAPGGTINLLARLVGNQAKADIIEQAWQKDACILPAHHLDVSDQHIMATMNWSFGLDARMMSHLEAHRHEPLALRMLKGMLLHRSHALKDRHQHQSTEVIADGQSLGSFAGGIFSLLPSYAHPLCQLYPKTQKWHWHGFLFKRQSLGRQFALATTACFSPLAHQNITQVQAHRIEIKNPVPLQIDGEAYGEHSITANLGQNPLRLIAHRPPNLSNATF